MNKKIVKKFCTFLTAFMVMLTSLGSSNIHAAEEKKVIQPYMYEIKKENGDLITSNDYIKFTDKLKIGFSYTIGEDEEVDTTNPYHVNLPSKLIWPDVDVNLEEQINLKYKNEDKQDVEVKLGTLYVKSGEVTIKYDVDINDTLAKLGEVNVHVNDLAIFANLDKKEIGLDQSVTIDLGKGNSLTINVDDNRIIQPEITSKDVEYINGVFTWTIKINKGIHPDNTYLFENFVLEDTFSNNQEFIKDSFKVDGVVTSLDPIVDTTIKYTFPTLQSTTDKKEVIITYQTKPLDTLYYEKNDKEQLQLKNIDSTFSNKANLKDSNDTVISSKETKKEVKETWLTKTSKVVDGGKNIEWTLTINAVNRKGLTIQVYDVITQGNNYIKAPTKLETVNGNTTDLPDVQNGFEYKGKTYGTDDAITFTLSNINEICTVTYKTPINNSYFEQNNKPTDFENEAWIDVKWDTGNGEKEFVLPSIEKNSIKVPTSLISKSVKEVNGAKYNPSTQEITWEIKVNENKIDMKEVIVKDLIPTDQVYVSHTGLDNGSFTIVENNPVFTLGNIGTSTKTFTITTKVIDKNFIASNTSIEKNISNKVELSYSYESDATTRTAESTASFKPKSTVLEKKASTYDYDKQTQIWEINVNKNNMELENVVIADTIPDNQVFVEDSLKLNENTLTQDANELNYYEIVDGNLVVYLKNKITDLQTLTYETKVDINKTQNANKNAKVKIENSVAMTMDTYPKVEGVKASKEINNTLIKKSSVAQIKEGFIDYQVIINQNRVTLEGMNTIVDTLSTGLHLDIDSIQIHHAKIDKDGKFTKTDKLAEEEYSYLYKAGTTNNILKITFKNTIDDAYIISYRADIAGSGKLTNSIAFKGQTGALSSSSDVSIDGNASAEAALKRKGKLSLTLYQTGTTIPLDNTEFYLMQGDNIVQKATTDAFGNIDFSLLNLNKPYTIQQVTTKEGYLKESEDDIEFTLTSTTLKEEIVYNDIVKNDISFIVKDKNDTPIKNAEFEIFAKDDNTFSNPIQKVTSDKDGNVIFPDMPFGDYVIKQITTESGYNKNPEIFQTTIKTDGTFTGIKDSQNNDLSYVENELTTGYGTIQVVIQNEDKEPLVNVEFVLLDENGKEIGKASSDANGILRFEPQVEGTYQIKQLTTVPTYDENTDIYTAVVETQKDTLVVVINYKSVIPAPIPPNNQMPMLPLVPATPTLPEAPTKKEPLVKAPETNDTSHTNDYLFILILSACVLLLAKRKQYQ